MKKKHVGGSYTCDKEIKAWDKWVIEDPYKNDFMLISL